MTEKQLQAAIVELARLTGWLVYHTHDSRKSEPGFPDLCMVRKRDGRLIFAELKSAKAKLSDEQIDWGNALMQDVYREYYVWRPSDWQDGRIERTLFPRKNTANAAQH